MDSPPYSAILPPIPEFVFSPFSAHPVIAAKAGYHSANLAFWLVCFLLTYPIVIPAFVRFSCKSKGAQCSCAGKAFTLHARFTLCAAPAYCEPGEGSTDSPTSCTDLCRLRLWKDRICPELLFPPEIRILFCIRFPDSPPTSTAFTPKRFYSGSRPHIGNSIFPMPALVQALRSYAGSHTSKAAAITEARNRSVL